MLTALQVKHAKPGKHLDHHGLCLVVRPSGGKFWTMRIQRGGRRREFGLGSAYDVSLDEARAKAYALRQRVKRGENPQQPDPGGFERPLPARVAPKLPTFEKAARDCYDALKDGWDDKRKRNWLSSFEQHVFPLMGATRIDEVDTAAVRDALAPVWLKIPDTSRRILQRMQAVLDFAHIKGWREAETSLRTVRKGLPRHTDRSNHYAAMPYAEAPALARKLRDEDASIGRDALRFLILTAARSGEVRGALWSEIDRTRGIWSIPADRMKAREPHTIPLSTQALSILDRLWKVRTSNEGLIFTSTGTAALSDMTLSKVLKASGADAYTVHGFRSAFTDWASEQTSFPKEVADKALAHKVPDRVEAAYRRTDFFEKRRELMKLWADFLDADDAKTAAKPGLPLAA